MIQMLKCPTVSSFEQQTSALILHHLMDQTSWAKPTIQEMAHIESFRWTIKTYQKGSCFLVQGDSKTIISILLSGWAFRFQTLPEGKRQILDFVFDGALLGFGAGNTNGYGVEAVTTCTVASLQSMQFRRLLSGCPVLAINVAERVADSEMRAYEHLTSLGRRTARERVAALLVELMERTKHPASTTIAKKFELPISQIMIGDALGLSNEHVCRTLAKLVGDGVIELSRHAVLVLDLDAIVIEAGLDTTLNSLTPSFEECAA